MDSLQRATLNAVKREGGTAYVTALPGLTGLDRDTVTAYVDQLVNDGYLARGRGQLVIVTPKGKAAR